MSTTLLIARHGNTFGPDDVVTRQGKGTDLPLVAAGLEQGTRLGLHLKAENLVPDMIYTSTLQRTKQTAQQIADAAGAFCALTPLAMFDEIDYGPDENMPETAVRARVGDAAILAWDESGVVPDGWRVEPKLIETAWQNFADMILAEHSGRCVLVVTSNGIARFAPVLTGDAAGFRDRHSLKLATGAYGRFGYHGNHWHCSAWNLRP